MLELTSRPSGALTEPPHDAVVDRATSLRSQTRCRFNTAEDGRRIFGSQAHLPAGFGVSHVVCGPYRCVELPTQLASSIGGVGLAVRVAMRLVMAHAVYKIVAHNGGWGVLHDGTVSGDYLTKEAAFEAVRGACL
jgi:hypothetical protein